MEGLSIGSIVGAGRLSMQVGDLVRCMMVDGNPAGLVMEKHSAFLVVLISGWGTACFQPHQLETINASR